MLQNALPNPKQSRLIKSSRMPCIANHKSMAIVVESSIIGLHKDVGLLSHGGSQVKK